jgi:hypothetical protein
MLHEAQNAFRRGRSTDQHIYTLSQVLRGRLRQGKATYAFFLDLKKAYDTVWRDGLLYKLWNRGIRGKAWQYIRNMYATTTRAVRCGRHTSEWFGIDLGTAQGDTLSCLLFDIYVDDLLREVDAACEGVPLPVGDPAPPQGGSGGSGGPAAASPHSGTTREAPVDGSASTSLTATLKALMFADDFTGVAETSEALQTTVDTCHQWCSQWRMAANVGPTKSAVVVFAPQFASETSHALHWGGTPLPATDAYKYLGVKLHADCTWRAHIQHAADKGRAASYAAAPILHNRRLHLAVRRMVFLSVVRPVMDYAATVWHGTDVELAKIEQVQTRVLRRLVAARENLADDFLRCELACRHTACIGQQRKLEFAFELQRMPPGRLPAQVAKCDWGKNPVVRGRARPKMHTDVVRHIAAQVGQHPDQAAATEEVSAAAFKADVKTAVLTTEMKRLTSAHARASGRSTVAEYLSILGPAVTEFPNNLPKYLQTPLHRGAQLKLLFRAGFAPVAHTRSKRTKTNSACAFCDDCPDETAEHFALECPAFHELRQQLLTATRTLVGEPKFRAWCQLPLKTQLQAVLGDQWWGAHAKTGDEWVQTYLLHLERQRAELVAGAGSHQTAGAPFRTLSASSAGARAHGFGYG